MECQGERVKLSAIKGCGSKPTEADMRKVKQEILSTLNRIKQKKYFCVLMQYEKNKVRKFKISIHPFILFQLSLSGSWDACSLSKLP